jgi:deoxyhypusine synthase
MQADYSMLMPFVVKALLENRDRYARWAEKMGEEALFAKHPKARGYLRSRDGYRLFDKRDALTERLVGEVRKNRAWLLDTLQYPLVAK